MYDICCLFESHLKVSTCMGILLLVIVTSFNHFPFYSETVAFLMVWCYGPACASLRKRFLIYKIDLMCISAISCFSVSYAGRKAVQAH